MKQNTKLLIFDLLFVFGVLAFFTIGTVLSINHLIEALGLSLQKLNLFSIKNFLAVAFVILFLGTDFNLE